MLVGDGSFLRRQLARARLVLRGDRLGSWYLDTYPARASQPAQAVEGREVRDGRVCVRAQGGVGGGVGVASMMH